MIFSIVHKTHYTYSAEIFPEPHYLRFQPKTYAGGQLTSFELDIHPKPAGLSPIMDAESNNIHLCWFGGLTDELTIIARSVYETKELNPFNFMLYPIAEATLPYRYPENISPILSPFLESLTGNRKVIDYGVQCWEASGGEFIPFLMELTRKIHSEFTVEYREEGIPHDPWFTLETRSGSCRDLAWMQIALLRALGFASRFVSGYYYIPMEVPNYELHGWVEVFLPGAGWRGFDPTHGIATGSHHLPVAASSRYENTMPVTGAFRGDAASSLTTDLHISLIG